MFYSPSRRPLVLSWRFPSASPFAVLLPGNHTNLPIVAPVCGTIWERRLVPLLFSIRAYLTCLASNPHVLWTSLCRCAPVFRLTYNLSPCRSCSLFAILRLRERFSQSTKSAIHQPSIGFPYSQVELHNLIASDRFRSLIPISPQSLSQRPPYPKTTDHHVVPCDIQQHQCHPNPAI